MNYKIAVIVIALLFGVALGEPPVPSAGRQVVEKQWTVNGVERTGEIELPAEGVAKLAGGWPVVFLFHGHGGKAGQIRRSFEIGDAWPGVMVVSLQGLPTVGQLTDPTGQRAGWDVQTAAATNKDLAFFDVALASVKKDYAIDPKRVFATGTSNGGSFTYFLWAMRGDVLAAVAPSSSVMGRNADKLTPKPAMLISGEQDPLVKFAWQQKMAGLVEKLDQVEGAGKPWAAGGKEALWYESALKMAVVTVFYDGGHAPPKDVGARIAAFFKAVGGE
jgi:polyhydroxybutyrate depolymerase